MPSLFAIRWGACALGLAALAASPRAFAQIPVYPGPESQTLVPPALLERAEATYPAAAKEQRLSAQVALRLSVDESGAVTDVEVLEPAGNGFDEAAIEAARRFRFEPARRGGTPIASRIKYVYAFELPVEASPPVAAPAAPPVVTLAPSQPSPVSAPTAPPPAAVVDVNVEGQLTAEQKLQQSADAVNVIDMRRAREQAADMGEVLARSQGVTVRRSGGLGSGERFALNGLYDEQIAKFIDGIPLEITSFTFGVSTIPVNFVDHVEIYRGVVPIRFGADALGGAVNFVTDQEYRTHASASYQIGSFGLHRATAGGRYRHDATGFVAGAEAFFDQADNDYLVDVEIPDERGRLSPARVPRFHDGYRAGGGAVEVGVIEQPWAKRLLLRGFYGGTAKEIQHNIVMTVPYGEVRYTTSNYGAILRYEVEPWRSLQLELVGAYSKRTIHFVDDSNWVYTWRNEKVRERRIAGELESTPSDQTSWEHSGFGRLGASWQLTRGHRLSFSSSPTYATRTGDERLQADPAARDPLNAERVRFSLVSGLEYQVDLFDDRLQNVLFAKDYVYRAKSQEVLAGGALKRRDADRHREGVGDALRFRFAPWFYAKASYELATRLPGTEELFGDGVLVRANLDLAPEISHNANVGPRLELKRTRFGDFVAEVNAFFRDSDQLIVLLGNDRFYMYQNVYRAVSKGLENMVDWTSPGRYVNLNGGLTWTDQRNASSEGTFADSEGDRIPNRPYLNGSWGARLRFSGFPGGDDTLEPYYIGRYVHEFYRGWESQGQKEYKQVVDSQILHTCGVTWSLSEDFGRVTTTFEVDNLTNTRAFDNFGVEKPGRALYLKLAAEL